MSDTESWYEGAGGTRLFVRHHPAQGATRASLIALHGLGDHSGLYPMLGQALGPRGIAVTLPDLRGNGRSPGPRGHIDRWTDLREDLHRLVGRTRAEAPAVPLMLLGSSLGALIVLDYAMHHPDELAGVIALAPPLGSLGVPAPLLALGRVLSRVWPGFSLETGMDLSGLSRDPSVVDQILADPLYHRRGSARLSTEISATIERVQQGAPTFPTPVLVVHGSADRMVPPDGSRRFVARLGQADATLLEIKGAYHALLADLDHERVLAAIGDWMLARS